MPPRRATNFSKPRHVTILGDTTRALSLIELFVSGKVSITLFTHSNELLEHVAPFPGVNAYHHESWETAPNDLSEGPYFVCVDRDEDATRIKEWLPNTVARFFHGSEGRTTQPPAGYLQTHVGRSQVRRDMFRRLGLLKRLDRLLDMARGAELPVILLYGDPDPDAIGSALGLAHLWRSVGAQPLIRYTGEVRRYQNKLLLSYVKETIEPLRDEELAGSDLVAVVDAQPGFWKESPPHAHVVIDHHPKREDTQAAFTDVRDYYGSCASIITEYLAEANFKIGKRLATALLYGLMTDTNGLQRNTDSRDIKAYDVLHSRSDQNFLARLVRSQVPLNILDYMAWGISHRIVFRDMMLVHFGEIPNPDILVQSADLMMLTCGINWVVCAGKIDDRMTVVFRGDGHRQDVGARAKNAFGKIGSAGGHRTMGRAEFALDGEHVDASADILVNNLFRRMSQSRRDGFIRQIRNYLHGAGPTQPEQPERW